MGAAPSWAALGHQPGEGILLCSTLSGQIWVLYPLLGSPVLRQWHNPKYGNFHQEFLLKYFKNYTFLL